MIGQALFWGAAITIGATSANAKPSSGWGEVPGGRLVLQYGDEVTVEPFLMATTPTTNAQFLEFTRAHADWRRGLNAELFADEAYLSHWESPVKLGDGAPPNAPVTNVSWFAARAYCKQRDARLPTLAEWEWAAAASETVADARRDSAHHRRILEWYSRPTPSPLPNVRHSYENLYGIWDLHALVWEWVEDFNAVMMSGASRKDQSFDRALFCAAGAVGTADPKDYAAFLRYAMRGSLKARHSIRNLGFRCVRDVS